MRSEYMVILAAGVGLLGMFYMIRVNYLLQKKLKDYEGNKEVTDKEALEIARRNEGFKNIMDYDVNVALGRVDYE